ncbi:hypothetical protein PoB_002565000 [Plakobranchus ocellatus]|uniref:Uncharacterized protein n=1 Tax=Plakobranchus ocellatus TaxID=259542 RepID=A0AAV3ZWY6_9GAST|nr:hypothetical protein PoB_002565000 [Plakobranchus ocellatus]
MDTTGTTEAGNEDGADKSKMEKVRSTLTSGWTMSSYSSSDLVLLLSRTIGKLTTRRRNSDADEGKLLRKCKE